MEWSALAHIHILDCISFSHLLLKIVLHHDRVGASLLFNDVIDDYLLVRVIQVRAKKDCLATLVLFHNLFDCRCVLGFLIFVPRVEEGATSVE